MCTFLRHFSKYWPVIFARSRRFILRTGRSGGRQQSSSGGEPQSSLGGRYLCSLSQGSGGSGLAKNLSQQQCWLVLPNTFCPNGGGQAGNLFGFFRVVFGSVFDNVGV